MTQNEILKTFENTGALLNGHFELRSGLHSDRFFQCANVLRFPRIAEQLCAQMVRNMKEELGDAMACDLVISPALGGIIVGHEVARALDVKCIFAEKVDDKLVLRRFSIKPGDRVVIAEDVVTRGGRVQETVDIVEQCGGIVAGIGVLVDRSGGKASFSAPLVSLVQVEPVTYDPDDCPLCKRGLPMVHPGS